MNNVVLEIKDGVQYIAHFRLGGFKDDILICDIYKKYKKKIFFGLISITINNRCDMKGVPNCTGLNRTKYWKENEFKNFGEECLYFLNQIIRRENHKKENQKLFYKKMK